MNATRIHTNGGNGDVPDHCDELDRACEHIREMKRHLSHARHWCAIYLQKGWFEKAQEQAAYANSIELDIARAELNVVQNRNARFDLAARLKRERDEERNAPVAEVNRLRPAEPVQI